MNRDELFVSMLTASDLAGETIYVERRGDEYAWARVDPGAFPGGEGGLADAWIYYTGEVPNGAKDRFAAFFDDLLDELESMAGGDRCRWPLDEPWPHPRH